MAKKYKRKMMRTKDLKALAFPLKPWDQAAELALFRHSQIDGHRAIWFKCTQCGLEYEVRTWRSGEDVDRHFAFCPDCGSQGASACIRVSHELGPIYQALHSPPDGSEGS